MTLILTLAGQAAFAAAAAPGGDPVAFSKLVVGDGNGSPITPLETATELARQVYEVGVQTVAVDAQNANQLNVVAQIPSAAGPFIMREVGLETADGTLLAIADYPETVKSVASQGIPTSIEVTLGLVISETANVTIELTEATSVSTDRRIDSGDGLTGGGDLSQDRTLSLDIDGLSAITGANVNPSEDKFVILDKSAGKPKKLSPADVAVAIGLQAAIDASAIANLDELDDVDDTAAADNQALMWLTNAWKPTTIQISHVASLTSALSGKSATGHGHVTTDISDFSSAVDARIQAIVDAAPANLDTLNEIAAALGDDANFAATMTANLAGKANVSHSHSWSDITGKPSTFAPSSHSHAWGEITGKPSTFTPSSHSHSIADVSGLQAELDAKAEFYTGTTNTNTNYPIGTIILVFGNSGVSLNHAASVKQSSGATFYFDTGTTLSGTWRNRGYTIGNGAYGTLMQRTA